jgi:hypothetical protein
MIKEPVSRRHIARGVTAGQPVTAVSDHHTQIPPRRFTTGLQGQAEYVPRLNALVGP